MATRFRSMHSILIVTLAAVLLGTCPTLFANPDTNDDAMILVAQPRLRDALYGSTILIAKPMPDGSSLGFILNKPTPLTLGQLFPEHEPSRNVSESIFLGGPVGINMITALVERSDSPGQGSIRISPDLYLVVNGNTVDRVIQSDPGHARFFAGIVVWRPGELAEELERGYWYEMATDTRLVFHHRTDGLWKELVQHLEFVHNGI